jgi:hypothetical protein
MYKIPIAKRAVHSRRCTLLENLIYGIVNRMGQVELVITFGLHFLGFEALPLFLVHFAVGAPAQEEEGDDDEETAYDRRGGEGLSRAQPVDDGDEEDGQEGGYRRENGGGEGDEDEEASREGW